MTRTKIAITRAAIATGATTPTMTMIGTATEIMVTTATAAVITTRIMGAVIIETG